MCYVLVLGRLSQSSSLSGPTGAEGDDKKDNLEDSVVNFLANKLEVPLTENDISACHILRKRSNTTGGQSNKPSIIVRFVVSCRVLN